MFFSLEENSKKIPWRYATDDADFVSDENQPAEEQQEEEVQDENEEEIESF